MSTSNCQGLSTTLQEIIKSDDETRLVDMFRDHPIDVDIINSLVNDCVQLLASRCLIALIRGEVCNMHPKFDAGKFPDSGISALAYIAHCCPEESETIDLIFSKCGGSCLANVYCTIGAAHGLPLHFLLINLSVMEHLYLWYRGTPIVRLVLLLCVWETKPVLDSVRVLVKHTDSINSIAWTMLSNGGLKQFAALLLIAREKVMAPFDTGLTINHLITSEINLVPEDEPTLNQVEYKCILRDAQTLVALFELAGDDLNSYCSSMQEYVSADDVVDDVCGLLIKHNILIMKTFDLILTDYNVKGYTARAISDSPDKNPLSRMGFYFKTKLIPKEALDQTSAYSRFYKLLRGSSRPCWGVSIPFPKRLQERHYSTQACQVWMMSKLLPPTAISPMPPRRLGHFTLKYIAKVRFL